MADDTTTEAEQDDVDEQDEQAQEASADAADDAVEESEDAPFDADRALAKIRKLNSENKNLRDAKKVAEEKAAGTDEKDTRIQALEAENLRIRIGARHGLPDELIDRLKGDSEEEILADAEKLLALVSTRKAPPTRQPREALRGGGDPSAPTEETDVSKLGERMFRR